MKTQIGELNFLRNILSHVLEAYLTPTKFAEVRDCNHKDNVLVKLAEMNPYRDHDLTPKSLLKLIRDVRQGMDIEESIALTGAVNRVVDNRDVTYGDIIDLMIVAYNAPLPDYA